MARPFSWAATTVKYPAILKTTPTDGSTESDYSSVFSIEFVSPMDEESMKGRVIITPDIIGDPDGLYSPGTGDRTIMAFIPPQPIQCSFCPA